MCNIQPGLHSNNHNTAKLKPLFYYYYTLQERRSQRIFLFFSYKYCICWIFNKEVKILCFRHTFLA